MAASANAFEQAGMTGSVKTGYAPVSGLNLYYEVHGSDFAWLDALQHLLVACIGADAWGQVRSNGFPVDFAGRHSSYQ